MIRRCLVLAIAMFGVAVPSTRAQTEPGFPLDPTFARDFTPMGVSNSWEPPNEGPWDSAEVTSLVGYPDGRVLVLWYDSPLGLFAKNEKLTRLLADGSVDVSFGAGGPSPGTVDVTPEGASAVKIDAQSRILIGGSGGVQRLLDDGTPDLDFRATCIFPCTFTNGGTPPLMGPGTVAVSGTVNALWTESDGSIILTTIDPDGGFLMKLTSSGDRDLAFNSSAPVPGLRRLDAASRGSAVRLSDGSILLVSKLGPTIRRFLPDGSSDMSFGGGTGEVTLATGDPDISMESVQAHGPAALLLYVISGLNTKLLLRLDLSGQLDMNFGTNGRFEIAKLGGDPVGGIAVTDDRRILLTFPGFRSTAARLTADGRLDASFNPRSSTPGWLRLTPTSGVVMSGPVLVRPDRVIVGGALVLSPGQFPLNNEAAVYAFLETPGPPQPVEPYPILAPPPPVPAGVMIKGPASAYAPAQRLGRTPLAG